MSKRRPGLGARRPERRWTQPLDSAGTWASSACAPCSAGPQRLLIDIGRGRGVQPGRRLMVIMRVHAPRSGQTSVQCIEPLYGRQDRGGRADPRVRTQIASTRTVRPTIGTGLVEPRYCADKPAGSKCKQRLERYARTADSTPCRHSGAFVLGGTPNSARRRRLLRCRGAGELRSRGPSVATATATSTIAPGPLYLSTSSSQTGLSHRRPTSDVCDQRWSCSVVRQQGRRSGNEAVGTTWDLTGLHNLASPTAPQGRIPECLVRAGGCPPL
jgi:hypothetical protein